MESLFNLPRCKNKIVKVLQITDTHLFANVSETLLGINTYSSYQAVINEILFQKKQFKPDLIVATGDIAQDNSSLAYQYFAEGMVRLSTPWVWLPGNHDFQPTMASTFSQLGVISSKRVLLGKHWHLILLDSQVLGVAHGILSQYQLAWLEESLNEYPNRHTMILLHHHPCPSGSAWLDQHSLRNSHLLSNILRNYTHVRLILCGHIHQVLDKIWCGIQLLSSPSTSIQFLPNSADFMIDNNNPGWRRIELFPDGSVKTKVLRLISSDFKPDMDSNGY